jgi:hypothetical protein
MAKFNVQPGGVPPGTYRARFLGVEDTTHVEYGAGLRFVFQVLTGDYAGQKTSRITATAVTPRNSAGRMIAGLLGRELTPGEDVDPDELVGREYFVEVETAQNGATRVASVIPVGVV